MRKYKISCCIIFTLILVIMSLIPAEANETVILSFGHSESESDDLIASPYTALTSTFKNIVEQQTQGRIKVETYPNFQTGSLESQIQMVSTGKQAMSTGMAAGNLSVFDPIFQLIEIPYLFPSTEVAREVLGGPFGDKMNERLIESANMRVLVWLPTAFRSFTNNVRPIRTPEDMKGLKIRVMNIPIHIKMVEALGASATPIAWDECYTALQMGVIDGHENAPYTILLQSIQEVQKYYTLDKHLVNAVPWIINEDIFQSFSPSDKDIIQRAAREAQFAFLGLIAAKESQDLKKLAEKMEIYTPTSDELTQFREKVQPEVIEILKQDIDVDLINELLKTVEDVKERLGGY